MCPEGDRVIVYDAIARKDIETDRVTKTLEEWRTVLPENICFITREKGTEAPFSGHYDKFYQKGLYVCSLCGNHLFLSDTKFNSQTGWPSFFQPVSDKNICFKEDNSLGASRTEVLCARCGSHLGHVFNDGPPPTGKRYCMNSAALKFIPVKVLGEEKEEVE